MTKMTKNDKNDKNDKMTEVLFHSTFTIFFFHFI
jgi:hypothetical protein